MTEHEALQIIRKQGDIRKGCAFSYNAVTKKLVTRPCKLNGEFLKDNNSTLYMFGDEVKILNKSRHTLLQEERNIK